MNLKDYCKKCGSQEKAAHKIGITVCNLNRILNGHQQPSPLCLRSMESLGVTWELKDADYCGGCELSLELNEGERCKYYESRKQSCSEFRRFK